MAVGFQLCARAWQCPVKGQQLHPPDSHGILAVDLLHGLDVSVQLRVPVQVGGAGPLWHSTHSTVTPRASHSQPQAGDQPQDGGS